MELRYHHGTQQNKTSERVRQLQGYLAGSARQQDTADDHRSSSQPVQRSCGDPAAETKRIQTESFNHQYDVRDSAATGVGTEETSSLVCMLYRPYQSVRLRLSNPPLKTSRHFWRTTGNDLGHLSTSRWHASMLATRWRGVIGVVPCRTGPSSNVRARAPPVQHLLRGG